MKAKVGSRKAEVEQVEPLTADVLNDQRLLVLDCLGRLANIVTYCEEGRNWLADTSNVPRDQVEREACACAEYAADEAGQLMILLQGIQARCLEFAAARNAEVEA